MLGRSLDVGGLVIVGAKLGKKEGIVLGTLDSVGDRDGSSDRAALGAFDNDGRDDIEGFGDGPSEATRVGEKEAVDETELGGGTGTTVGTAESVAY